MKAAPSIRQKLAGQAPGKARYSFPRPLASLLQRRDGSIRVVEREDLGLRKNIHCSAARRMERIALDLDRAPLLGPDVHAAAVAVQLHRGGENRGNTRRIGGRVVGL